MSQYVYICQDLIAQAAQSKAMLREEHDYVRRCAVLFPVSLRELWDGLQDVLTITEEVEA